MTSYTEHRGSYTVDEQRPAFSRTRNITSALQFRVLITLQDSARQPQHRGPELLVVSFSRIPSHMHNINRRDPPNSHSTCSGCHMRVITVKALDCKPELILKATQAPDVSRSSQPKELLLRHGFHRFWLRCSPLLPGQLCLRASEGWICV